MYLDQDDPSLHRVVSANLKHHGARQQPKHLNFQARSVVLSGHLHMLNHSDRSDPPDLKFHRYFLTQLAA